MNCSEVLAELKIRASEKYKANAVRMGIPEQYSLGVSTAEVRSLAKRDAYQSNLKTLFSLLHI